MEEMVGWRERMEEGEDGWRERMDGGYSWLEEKWRRDDREG
jgi:hypothetical protein